MAERPPKRVTITRPRNAAAAPPKTGARTELNEQTRVGVVLVTSLRRAQLRLALVIGTLLVVLLGGIPLLFLLDPALAQRKIGHVPIAWLVLGIAVYPAICIGAWWFVRGTERREDEFVELVDRS